VTTRGGTTSSTITSSSPVIDQNPVAGVHIGGQRLVRDGDIARSGRPLGYEDEILTSRQHHGRGQFPDANARTLEVAEDRDRPPARRSHRPHPPDRRRLFRMRAVREIDAGHIHAGIDQSGEDLVRRAGRTQGAHDLGASPRVDGAAPMTTTSAAGGSRRPPTMLA